MKMLTGKDRLRQVKVKARIRGERNLRLWLEGRIDILPCNAIDDLVVAEFDRLTAAIQREARSA